MTFEEILTKLNAKVVSKEEMERMFPDVKRMQEAAREARRCKALHGSSRAIPAAIRVRANQDLRAFCEENLASARCTPAVWTT